MLIASRGHVFQRQFRDKTSLFLVAGLATLLLLEGCFSPPVDSPEIKALRTKRQGETFISLETRVAEIERRIFGEFYEPTLGLISQSGHWAEGRFEPGPVNVETNSHLLAGLAYQFAVTGNRQAETRARHLLAGLKTLDMANGLDGFLPLEARLVDGQVVISSERFVASSYTQLVYAFTLSSRLFADPGLKAEIQAQANRLIGHLLEHGFTVLDGAGNELPYSDFSPCWEVVGSTRQLQALSFVRAADHFALPHSSQAITIEHLRRQLEEDYRYNRLPYVLHISLPPLELPTASSSWLNLLRLAILVEVTGDEKYRRLLHGLIADYRAHENPFFIALDLLHGPSLSEKDRAELLQTALKRLQTYPLTNTSHELDNCGRPPYHLRFPPRFIKNTWSLEAAETIPFYDLAGDHYLWKRNLRLLHGNIGGDGTVVYPGVDCFEAYWMLAYAAKCARSLE